MPLFFYSFVLLPAHELRGLPGPQQVLGNPELWVHSWLAILTKQKGTGFIFQAIPHWRKVRSQGCHPGTCGHHRPTDVTRAQAVPSEVFFGPNRSFFSFCSCSQGTEAFLGLGPPGRALMSPEDPTLGYLSDVQVASHFLVLSTLWFSRVARTC